MLSQSGYLVIRQITDIDEVCSFLHSASFSLPHQFSATCILMDKL